MNDYSGKKILIVGAARSGLAAAKLLSKRGATITLYDQNPNADLSALEGYEILTQLGGDISPEGFDALLISPAVPIDAPIVKTAREAGVYVTGEMETAFSCSVCNVAAVTGTNGKTTTTALLTDIIRAERPASKAVGNIGEAFANHADALKPDDWAVAEVSSFQAETFDTFKPKVAAILNVTPDHLNRHYTMAGYIAAKERVFMNQSGGDWAVFNADDAECVEMAERLSRRDNPPNIAYFSRVKRVGGAFVDGRDVVIDINGKVERLLPLTDIPLPGSHNVENVLASALCAYLAGISPSVIARRVRTFKGVEHRVEFVVDINGARYYNDSKATNPDAAIKGLTAFDAPVCLIGGGRDKDMDFEPWVALFPKRVKFLALIGEAAGKIAALCDGIKFKRYEIFDSLEQAVIACGERAERGDVVLLSPACASFDMFKDYEDRGDRFKAIAANAAGEV